MASIETVSIEDVFPLEDEYGNSMARRDYTLKANKDYVKRLAESFNPETKQPDEPPVRTTLSGSRDSPLRLPYPASSRWVPV